MKRDPREVVDGLGKADGRMTNGVKVPPDGVIDICDDGEMKKRHRIICIERNGLVDVRLGNFPHVQDMSVVLLSVLLWRPR